MQVEGVKHIFVTYDSWDSLQLPHPWIPALHLGFWVFLLNILTLGH